MRISTTGSSISRPGTMDPGPRNRGFTLIELVVVMALVAIMISLAVPNIRSALYTDELKATARRLTGLLSEAGQEVTAGQEPGVLVYEAAGRRFRLELAGRKKESLPRLEIPAPVQVVDIMSVHGGTRSSERMEIRFSSRGYVDKTLIHLRHRDGRELTLMVSPFLGVTRIFAGYLDLENEQIRW